LIIRFSASFLNDDQSKKNCEISVTYDMMRFFTSFRMTGGEGGRMTGGEGEE